MLSMLSRFKENIPLLIVADLVCGAAGNYLIRSPPRSLRPLSYKLREGFKCMSHVSYNKICAVFKD